MAKKVLFTGTLDAGKTTLIKEFANDPSVVVIPEVAQDLIDIYGYGITQLPEFQDMVFAEQIRREDEAERSGRSLIICDRGTVDIIAFCDIIGHQTKPEWEASLQDRYDSVFLFNKDDIDFDAGLYDVPFDIREYRSAVDSSIRRVLSRLNLPIIELQGVHEQRLRVVQENIFHRSEIEGNRGTEALLCIS